MRAIGSNFILKKWVIFMALVIYYLFQIPFAFPWLILVYCILFVMALSIFTKVSATIMPTNPRCLLVISANGMYIIASIIVIMVISLIFPIPHKIFE